jgi:hypothetical protein
VADPLLRAVSNFEVIYVSISEFNFSAAKTAFWTRFSNASSRSPRLFDDDARSVAAQHRAPPEARFTTLLLLYGYPQLQRSEVRGSERVRI